MEAEDEDPQDGVLLNVFCEAADCGAKLTWVGRARGNSDALPRRRTHRADPAAVAHFRLGPEASLRRPRRRPHAPPSAAPPTDAPPFNPTRPPTVSPPCQATHLLPHAAWV